MSLLEENDHAKMEQKNEASPKKEKLNGRIVPTSTNNEKLVRNSTSSTTKVKLEFNGVKRS